MLVTKDMSGLASFIFVFGFLTDAVSFKISVLFQVVLFVIKTFYLDSS